MMMMVQCMRTVHVCVNVLVRACVCARMMNGVYNPRERGKKWARLIFLCIQRSQPIKTRASLKWKRCKQTRTDHTKCNVVVVSLCVHIYAVDVSATSHIHGYGRKKNDCVDVLVHHLSLFCPVSVFAFVVYHLSFLIRRAYFSSSMVLICSNKNE